MIKTREKKISRFLSSRKISSKFIREKKDTKIEGEQICPYKFTIADHYSFPKYRHKRLIYDSFLGQFPYDSFNGGEPIKPGKK